jgi:hypothetical protein
MKPMKKELIETRSETTKLLEEINGILKNHSGDLDAVAKKKLMKIRDEVIELLRALDNILSLYPNSDDKEIEKALHLAYNINKGLHEE